MNQPPPIANDQPHIADLVIEDIRTRKAVGLRNYGHALQANNGRNALRDLYEELLDAVQYCKQELIERAALRDELARVTWERDDLQAYRDRSTERFAGLAKIADDAKNALAAAVAERDELKERNDRQAETLKLVGPYPHMCRTDHIQIGFAGEYREGDERCPVCILESERDELRRSLGEIGIHASDKCNCFGEMLCKATIAALVARHDTVRGEEGKDGR